MNKYKRLFLFILLGISLILLFVYKHKYSDLRTLFEIMQTFPGSRSTYLQVLKKSLDIDFQKTELIKGAPYWVEIFPGVFAYSTYWLSRISRTLMFAENLHLNDLKSIKCELLYESVQNRSDFITNIVYIQIERDKVFFYLDCKPILNTETPKSLVIAYRNLTSTSVIPKLDNQVQLGQYTMCIPPLNSPFFNVHELMEFIIYHYYVGIKYFIFYEDGLTYEVRKLLLDIAYREGIYILVKPWKVPFYSRNQFDTNEVAFLDCFHQVAANNQSSIVFKMDTFNFILPEKIFNLTYLIEDFNFQTKAFKFHEKMFCLEHKNDEIAANLNIPFITLLKYNTLIQTNVTNAMAFDVLKLKEHFLGYTSFQSPLEEKLIQEIKLIPKDKIVVHSYKKCEEQSILKTEVDKTMWSFKNVFFKSNIYLLAKKLQLILD